MTSSTAIDVSARDRLAEPGGRSGWPGADRSDDRLTDSGVGEVIVPRAFNPPPSRSVCTGEAMLIAPRAFNPPDGLGNDSDRRDSAVLQRGPGGAGC